MPSTWPLPILPLTPASAGAVCWRTRGVERITGIVKATFTLRHEASAELTAPLDIIRADSPWDGSRSLEEACETAPYLPSAGVLLRGCASAPRGQPALALAARLALYREGRWILNKALHVFGDRTRAAPSPRSFQRMPIVYERAYGGAHMAANPAGVSGAVLPNIVHPTDPGQPVGFGPIARQWAPRRYFRPWEPAIDPVAPEPDSGFDFRYFHAAPADQQVDFLRGDEWIALEGLHPEFPWLRAKLPSARGVAWLHRLDARGQDPFQPIELVADTLVIDADRLACSVIWRGNAALRSGDMPSRMRLLAGVELPGAPVSYSSPPLLHTPAEGSLPRRPRQGDAETAPLDPEVLAALRHRPVAPFALAEPAAMTAAEGHAIPGAPWSSKPAEPAPHPLEMTDLNITTQLESTPDEIASEFAPVRPVEPEAPPPPSAPRVGESDGAPLPLEPPPLPALPLIRAPLPEPEAKGLRAIVLARLKNGEPLHDLDLAGAELDGIDFSGASLASYNFAGSSLTRCNFDQARLTGADLRRADLTEATLREADLTDADLSRTTLARTQLSSAILKRADLSAAKGEKARFEDASLEGAELRQARLLDAVFDRANLAGIAAAKADLSRSSFKGAQMSGADLYEAKFDATDFGAVKASDLTFLRNDLSGIALAGAELTKCNFVEVNVSGVDFSGATLASSVFVSVKGDKAVFRGSKLGNLRVVKESSLAGADLTGASLEGATLRGTNLADSDLSGANLDGADLSECDLKRAKLYRATARGALFIRADLSRAVLVSANLMQAILQKAKLCGADFRGVNLFRADLAKVEGDNDTKLEGALVTQVRVVERRPHAQG